MNKTFFSLIFLSCFIVSSFSQEIKDSPVYYPVSPNAASFAKRGLYGVDYSTGKLDIGIPIYTIKTNELDIPISLSYNTAGIQLNELASWVGLGWNLNAGGAIVRNTKGIPDRMLNWNPILDLNNLEFNEFNYNNLRNQQRGGSDDTAPDEYVVNAPGLSGSFYFDQNDSYKAFFRDYQNTTVKVISEHEIEVIKEDGTIYRFGKSLQGNLAIEKTYHPQGRIPYIGIDFVSSWFLTEIISATKREILSFFYNQYESHDYPVAVNEALDYRGVGVYEVKTSFPSMNPTKIIKQVLSRIKFESGEIEFQSSFDREDLQEDYKLNSIKVYSTIDNLRVTIADYSFKYDYYIRSGGRTESLNMAPSCYNDPLIKNSTIKSLRLKNVINDKLKVQFGFEYNSNVLPVRGTTSQDYWGYINGNLGSLFEPTIKEIKNPSFVKLGGNPSSIISFGSGDRNVKEELMKSGVLEKIYYPEGGFSVFDYEANRYYDNVTVPSVISNSVTAVAYGNGCNYNAGSNYQLKNFSVGNNYVLGSGKLNIVFTEAMTEIGSNSKVVFNGENFFRPNPIGSVYPGLNTTISKEFSNSSNNNLEAYEYRGGNIGASGCPSATITATWNEKIGEITSFQSILVGGLRVKSVKNYDGINSVPISIKEYSYQNESVLNKKKEPYSRVIINPGGINTGPNIGDPLLSMSDGFNAYYAALDRHKTLLATDPYYYYDYYNDEIFKNQVDYSINKLQSGKTTFNNAAFTSVPDDYRPGKLFVCSTFDLFNNNIGGSPNVLYGKVTEIEKDPKTLQINGKTEYLYETFALERVIDFPPKIFCHPMFNFNKYEGTTWSSSYRFINDAVNSITDFAYYKNDSWNYGSLINTKIFKRDNSNTIKMIKSLSNSYSVLKTKKMPYNIVFNIFSSPSIDFRNGMTNGTYDQNNDSASCNYFYFSGGVSLGKKVMTSTIETDYDESENPTAIRTTNYFFDNPIHNQITRIETKNSKDELLISKMYYPDDLSNEPFMSELIAQNRKSVQVRTETYKNLAVLENKLSEQKTIFTKDASTGNLLLPKSIYSAKFPNVLPSIPNVGNLERKLTYDQYDGNGNLLQYTPEAGAAVSIIWGYNKTLPIAKIENATNVAISNVLGVSLASLNETDLGQINGLRTSLPNAMVTTYTHIPLVGVSTITDTKGLKTTYEYDAFNRLKWVKDHEGNILQKYCYNYKGQQVNCEEVVYKNVAKSGTFIKNNCGAGFTGSSVTYTVAAGVYSSAVSQAEADNRAQTDVDTNGLNYANANGGCSATVVYKNALASRIFKSQLCAPNETALPITYSVNAGTYTSTISQSDADSKALEDIRTKGQNYANDNGACKPPKPGVQQ